MEQQPFPRRRLHIELSILEKARLWAEIAAFVAAGCWALYTFIYQTRIAPALIPAHEQFTMSVNRLASMRSGSIERVVLTIRNDGTVDVDTAAFALDVYGATTSGLRSSGKSTPNDVMLHAVTPGSWQTLQSQAELLDGAVGGKTNDHIILRPGDSTDITTLVAVPIADHLLRVYFATVYARFPIVSRIGVRLKQTGEGAVDLTSVTGRTDMDDYFGV